MVIGPIESRAGEPGHEPAEYRLVPGVHPQGDLRLLAIATEGTLADQKADEKAPVELIESGLRGRPPLIRISRHAAAAYPSEASACFTVKKNVKRSIRSRRTGGHTT